LKHPLQTQITTIENKVNEINTEYTLNCISGVTDNTNTHGVLQAVITKLCSVNTALSALSLNVSTNYVKVSELNSLIAAYLSGGSSSTKLYHKMVPYTVVEFYGDITGKFDATGAGLGEWEKIYLCNGNNGTPDKRGRVSVGVTTGMGGGTLDTAVDPSNPGNPNYSLGTKYGSCMVSLNVTQIPSHSHTATNTVIDARHFHYLSTVSGQTSKPALSSSTYLASLSNYGDDGNYVLGGTLEALPSVGKSSTSTTNISVQTSLSNIGGGLGHNNVQPSIGCYYIMYIPS
jgi:microcystin-dependent protein